MSEGGKQEKKKKPFTEKDKERLQSRAATSPTPGKVELAQKVQSLVDKREAEKAAKKAKKAQK